MVELSNFNFAFFNDHWPMKSPYVDIVMWDQTWKLNTVNIHAQIDLNLKKF